MRNNNNVTKDKTIHKESVTHSLAANTTLIGGLPSSLITWGWEDARRPPLRGLQALLRVDRELAKKLNISSCQDVPQWWGCPKPLNKFHFFVLACYLLVCSCFLLVCFCVQKRKGEGGGIDPLFSCSCGGDQIFFRLKTCIKHKVLQVHLLITYLKFRICIKLIWLKIILIKIILLVSMLRPQQILKVQFKESCSEIKSTF